MLTDVVAHTFTSAVQTGKLIARRYFTRNDCISDGSFALGSQASQAESSGILLGRKDQALERVDGQNGPCPVLERCMSTCRHGGAQQGVPGQV